MKRFFSDEKGASMVEYALLLSLVTIISITIIASLGRAVNGMFANVTQAIQAATPQSTSTTTGQSGP